MSKFENYYKHVDEEAKGFVDQYFDDFCQKVLDGDTDVYEMIDYSGELHEYCDQYIDLRDAVEILEQSNNVETDSGLWDGLEPIQAVESMGFWTFKSDMYQGVKEWLESRFDDKKLELEAELEEKEKLLQQILDELVELKAEKDDLEDEDELDDEQQERYDEIERLIESLEDSMEDENGDSLEDVISTLEEQIENIEFAIDSL